MKLCVIFIIVISGFLSGCATNVPTMSDLEPIRAARCYAFKTPVENNVTLTFLRIKAFEGSAIDYGLLIDGTLAAKISIGEYVVLNVAPGEHIIETRHPSPLIGKSGDSITLLAEPNMKYYFRLIPGLRIVRTTEESATGPH